MTCCLPNSGLEFRERIPQVLKEQPEIGSVSIEPTEIKLTSTTL